METATDEKVYKIGQGWVDQKDAKVETKVETKEEVKTEETKTEDKVEETKKEEKPKEEEPKKEEKKEEKPDFSSYLKEKFNVDSEDDLDKILKTNLKLTEALEAEKKKVKEPVYKSERHKKLMEWLDGSGYDVDKINDGLETAATLVNLNLEKIDDRRALEEAFILENKEDLGREDAKKLFSKEYKKYNLNKDDFDDENEFKEEQELMDIQKKKDITKAKKLLASEQEKLKYVEPKKEEKKPEKIEIPAEVIDTYAKKVDSVFENSKGEKFDRLTFEDEKDPSIKFSIVFPEDKMKLIRQTSLEYVKRNDIYDGNKKIPNFDPLRHVTQVMYALEGDWLLDQMSKQVVTLAKTLRVEQLAGIKPDKESKAGGKGTGIPSYSEQFAELAKKEKEAREKAKR